MLPTRSLATQWALRYAIATFIVISGVLFFHYSQTRLRIERDAQLLLRLQANELVGQLHRHPDEPAALERYLDEHEAVGYRMLRLGFRVFDADREVILERGSFARVAIPLPNAFPDVPGHAVVQEQYAGEEYPFFTMVVLAPEGGWVQAAVYTEVFARSARELGTLFLLSIPVLLLITTAIGIALARATLRPIARIIETAEKFSATRRASPLPTTGSGDELDRLARAFNAMMERLHSGVERIQRFSAEVAHELRTPVSRMRVRVESALEEPRNASADRAVLNQTLSDVDRLSETIRAMLQLAHSEAGLDPERVHEIPLRDILEGVVEFFEPVAEEAAIELVLSDEASPTVMGDPNWLHQLFANLIDNAIKFSPSGRRVSVLIENGAGEGETIVVVEDNGPGIPATERGRVFESFHRLDASLPGSGLGLALAREIARAHGGDITLESELGKGSRFLVTLPCLTRPMSELPPQEAAG